MSLNVPSSKIRELLRGRGISPRVRVALRQILQGRKVGIEAGSKGELTEELGRILRALETDGTIASAGEALTAIAEGGIIVGIAFKAKEIIDELRQLFRGRPEEKDIGEGKFDPDAKEPTPEEIRRRRPAPGSGRDLEFKSDDPEFKKFIQEVEKQLAIFDQGAIKLSAGERNAIRRRLLERGSFIRDLRRSIARPVSDQGVLGGVIISIINNMRGTSLVPSDFAPVEDELEVKKAFDPEDPDPEKDDEPTVPISEDPDEKKEERPDPTPEEPKEDPEEPEDEKKDRPLVPLEPAQQPTPAKRGDEAINNMTLMRPEFIIAGQEELRKIYTKRAVNATIDNINAYDFNLRKIPNVANKLEQGLLQENAMRFAQVIMPLEGDETTAEGIDAMVSVPAPITQVSEDYTRQIQGEIVNHRAINKFDTQKPFINVDPFN